MAPTRVILMSCGSYNPPTNMHLRMFEIARDHLHRMGMHVVVGGVISPVHDAYAKKELASATHRCAMLRLALQNSDWIQLSTWETRQNCWTKTRVCLQHHQNLLNSMLSNSNDIKHHLQIEDTDWIPENVKNSSDNMPIQIKLLCGIDAIVGEHGLVVITREGSNPNKFIYDSDILSKHMNNICIVTEWIPNEVSSTRIRRALKRGESVRYLLQDSVIDYIYKHEIYNARMPDTIIKLELSSPNANNYLHIDPRYLTALLTPSPSDVTMGSPSPVEIVASIDVPDAVVLRKNLQNVAGNGGGLDEIREQFVSVISNNADNGNFKHVSRVVYPGQAKQIIASATGVARILDEVGALDELMTKSQPGPSSEEGRRSAIDSAGDGIARDKEVLNLGSKAEIIDVDLGSSEIIMKVSPGQPSSGEFVPKEYSRSIIKSLVKGQIEIGQKENLRSKMEVTDIDLDSNDDCKLIMKVQSSESSSGELRLGECCWPKRESAANDEVEIRDRNIMSEKRIIDAELGLNDKKTLKETRRSTVEAISDKVNSDRSRFSRVGSEKSSKSIVKSVVDGKVDVRNKEMINVEVEFTDVVKVQPVHSSYGILTLKDDRRLMIEKLTNELKIKLDEEKNKSKESSQVDKVGKIDTELTEFNAEEDTTNNIVVDDVGIDSRKETADFKSNRTKYLDAKEINVSMTSLDGRHECALSDFSVDKEDYRLSQYGFDEDEEENKKPIYTARLNLTKYADGQIENVTDNVDSVNNRENDNRTKSSDEADQLKHIVEESLSVAEVNDKDNNSEGGKQIEEIFKMSQETDKMSRIEKGSELDTHSSEKPMTSCDSSLEIDGKYLKSIVNSRKSPRKIKDGQVQEVFLDSSKKSSKNDSESELKKQNRHADNRETSRTEDPSQHSSKTSSVRSPKKIQTQKTVKMNDNKGQQAQEAIKTVKDTDNKTKCDFNEIKDVYTRKVRRYNVPLQGSLDSMIVSDETSTQKPKKDDAFSKKSKSYESIKRIQEVFLGVPPTKANSSGSQLDIPDEFCSICCYMNEITFRTEEEVSSPNQETFYTLRSTCSSLADDDDSIECDICGSLNLQESADDLEGKIQEIPCELCKICGEVDGSFDQDSTLPADRYTFKMIEPHQDDDDSFEIENCGFQSSTESADDRSRISDKERIKDPGRPKSQSLFIHGSSMNKDQPRELYFIPKDEIAILTSGTRKVNRKGSLFRKKEDSSGNAQDKRRYSSVDSLQLAKISSKGSDKVLKIAKNTTLIGSADNLQISRDSRRSKSLQRSADDVCKDRLNKSTDNLNSQTKNLGKENEAEDLTQKLNTRDKEEVKMILTQHGIKIIRYNKTCMPTIRQIVDCLVATHPIRACGSRRLLLSAIKSNRATNDFNQDTSMVTSNNNNESVESYQNTRNPYHDHPYI
ncbi:Nicotinamide mononucleotide adenylyltransferase 1 [Trachymyrmex zeteki]|uniref:Nicotinamide/nicotinic acid mononucleotide adenylyltransferase 3 n=2 Tax=Mycetomoellerius zeteki TaxID=64791 RepID=A0A151WEU9_9HYME|nr:Nicotinamide mononucleotide adenylyltransferase 1 [Trachymyrmex zeteki]